MWKPKTQRASSQVASPFSHARSPARDGPGPDALSSTYVLTFSDVKRLKPISCLWLARLLYGGRAQWTLILSSFLSLFSLFALTFPGLLLSARSYARCWVTWMKMKVVLVHQEPMAGPWWDGHSYPSTRDFSAGIFYFFCYFYCVLS